MGRSRQWLMVMIFLTVTIFCTIPAAAADKWLPPRPAEFESYQEGIPLYDRYDSDAYTFDYFCWGSHPADMDFNNTTNQIQTAKTWLIKLAIRVTEYAVSGQVFATFLIPAGQIMTALKDWFWETNGAPLVIGALALAGLLALAAAVAGRLTGSLRALAGTALVLLVSIGLMESAAEVFPTLLEISHDAARQGFKAVAVVSQVEDEPALVVKAGTAAWDALVYKPWISEAFLDHATAVYLTGQGFPGGKWLGLNIEERYNLFNNDPIFSIGHNIYYNRQDTFYKAPYFTGMQRRLTALITFFCGLAYGGAVLLLAGGIIGNQLFLLMLLALLPLWLLLALWGAPIGLAVFRRVITTGLGALVRQVVLSLTLAVLLAFTLLVALMPGINWAMSSLLLGIMGITIYICRYAWLGLADKVREKVVVVSGTDSQRTERQEEVITQAAVRTVETDSVASEDNALPRFNMAAIKPEQEDKPAPKRSLIMPATASNEFRREMSAMRQRLTI